MKISNQINIESSLENIWSKTVDVEAWPKWNPAMKKITIQGEGEFTLGSRALIYQEGLGAVVWTVSAFEQGKVFAWETRVFGMKMVATHELSVVEASVINNLSIEVGGIMGAILAPLLKGKLLQALVAENENFKKYCES